MARAWKVLLARARSRRASQSAAEADLLRPPCCIAAGSTWLGPRPTGRVVGRLAVGFTLPIAPGRGRRRGLVGAHLADRRRPVHRAPVRLIAADAGEGGSSRRVRARAPPLGWASWTWRRCRGCRRGHPSRERPQQRTCAFVPRRCSPRGMLGRTRWRRGVQYVEGSPEPVGRKARGARACRVGARAESRRAHVHDHALSHVKLSLSLSRLSLSLGPSLPPSLSLSLSLLPPLYPVRVFPGTLVVNAVVTCPSVGFEITRHERAAGSELRAGPRRDTLRPAVERPEKNLRSCNVYVSRAKA